MGEVQTAVAGGVVDVTTPQFARRFGALVRERRLATGDSIRSIARGSAGDVTVGLLRDIEDARVTLDHELVSLVASRYGADLAAILPERMSVSVADDGVIRSGPAERRFRPGDETALLTAYLALVRSMRRERDATIVLRRDDIEVLASHLRQPGSVVLDRLLSIMGSSRTQRSAVLALFATGAMVIGLVSSVAAGGDVAATTTVTAPADVPPAGRAEAPFTLAPIARDLMGTTTTSGPTSAVGAVRALPDQRDDVVGVARATPLLDLGPLAPSPDVATPSGTSASPEPVSPPQQAVGDAPVPPAPGAADPVAPPPPPPSSPVATVPPTMPYEPPPDQGTGDAPLPSFP